MTDTTGNPLVSIIVRTKDRPKLLKRALQSIAAQNYRPIEVVLVNDGGCDLDIEEIRGILGDVSLNYVRLEQNTGRAHAGNAGIENARGEYVGFLDDDDELYPEHVSTLGSFLNEKTSYIGAYTDTEIIERDYDGDGTVIREACKGLFRSWDFSYDVLLFENYIPLMCSLLRKEAIRNVGGLDEALEIFEDWDLFIRVAEKERFAHIPQVTTKYIHWSKTEQIAFVGWPEAKDYYIRVLSKHSNKITPETIYRYFLFKQGEMNAKQDEMSRMQKMVDTLGSSNIEQAAEFRRLSEELWAKKTRIERLQKKTEELGEELKAQDGESKTKQKEIERLHNELRARQNHIEEIENSLGWKALNFYRVRVKTKIFPLGTRREWVYKMSLKFLLKCRQYGMRLALRKLSDRLRERYTKRRIQHETFTLSLSHDEALDMIDAKVSVVIPTKNAGDEFRNTLEKIKAQRGFRELEIVVVDSGSADTTPTLAERYGAKVFFIDPKEFNHGKVRNIGAENAGGDYLVFMSQDVVPVGETCIYEIVRVMNRDVGIAAATIKQVPRSDADLFACWQVWNHYENFFGLSGDRITNSGPQTFSALPPAEKRRRSQIDNIFSCVRKDVFDRFKFLPLPYAEDLDLGLRLLAGGYKIAFLFSLGAIHSHNRDAGYFLRRSYIDWGNLIQLLGYEPKRWEGLGIASADDMLSHLNWFYCKMNAAIDVIKRNDVRRPAAALELVRASLRDPCVSSMTFRGERSIDRLMEKVRHRNAATFSGCGKDDILVEHYLDLLRCFETFLDAFEDISEKKQEFIEALYKFFALVAGSNIADFVAYSEKKTPGVRPAFDEMLGGNV